MCGGKDLIKQEGVFVCQSCGCKYSVEEAKKMMIEGTVDVQGTVKVDNSGFVEKYLANARRAKEKEDWEETEKYYNMVEQNDPDNIEAIFYSAYGKAKISLLTDANIYKRTAIIKVLQNSISVVDDHYKVERREENKKIIIEMATDLGKMICGDFVYNTRKNEFGITVWDDKEDTITLFIELINAFMETIDNIQKVDDQPYLHESAIALYTIAMRTGCYNNINYIKGKIHEETSELESLKEKRAIAEYWAEHAEEKLKLETEKAGLIEKINELRKSVDELPENNTIKEIEVQITSLKDEKNALGLFKVKERRALQGRINDLNKSLATANTERNNAVAPIEAEIHGLNERIKEIEAELSKNR